MKFRHPIWRCDYEESMVHASYPCVDGVCDVSDADDVFQQYLLNLGYEPVVEEAPAE